MGSALLDRVPKISRMGRKKKSPTGEYAKGGKHSTPRIAVAIPSNWHAVLRRIAAKRQQPVVFSLIAIVKAEAEAQGIESLPPTPWDVEANLDEPPSPK